jgi:hypothetical protein
MKSKPMYEHYIKYAPFDAIIVPGYPYYGDKWEDVVKIRVLWAKFLYEQGYAKRVIFSGSAVYSPYIESRIMKEYAIALGIDSNDIYTEERAEHSTENVYYSYQLAQKHGWENIALATDYVQVKMVRNFVSKKQIPIVYLPMLIHIVDTMAAFNMPPPQINDSVAFVPDFVPITERESMHKRWKGTRGRNISKEQKKKDKK